MGIEERRAREREQRKIEIVRAAWEVAQRLGWAGFSVERVASEAELGRATVYGYFESLETLVAELGREALTDLGSRLADASGLAEALDVPVRFSQQRPAAFELLFPSGQDSRPAFSGPAIGAIRSEARQHIARLLRLASRSRPQLPDDAKSAETFLAGIAMAATIVPELKESTTLRRRFHDFCLKEVREAAQQP